MCVLREETLGCNRRVLLWSSLYHIAMARELWMEELLISESAFLPALDRGRFSQMHT